MIRKTLLPPSASSICEAKILFVNGPCSGSLNFLRAIKYQFGYLFDQYQFQPEISTDRKHGEYCLTVLQSPECKIKFHLEQGTSECYFGTLESPSNWCIEENGLNGWYLINPILGFLGRRTPERAVPWPAAKGIRITDDILHGYSARLRPFIEDVISVFAGGLTADWWTAYRADFEERVRARKSQRPAGELI
ncbi:MAG TPA: hypothetical protein VKZ53_07845 [Candidatus Angelobacter sp.]|nr:hypothetical protein [Candidatus Angelobacter sp.]